MERAFKGVWIPAAVWISDDLSLQEKVFLVEIDSLDNSEGCFASNAYFADFFKLSKARVSQIIGSLKEKGYLKEEFQYNGKQVTKRILRISRPPYPDDFSDSKNPKGSGKFSKGGSKNPNRGGKNSKGGCLENYKDNNTINNNIYNNTSIIHRSEGRKTMLFPVEDLSDWNTAWQNAKIAAHYNMENELNEKTRKAFESVGKEKIANPENKIQTMIKFKEIYMNL